MIISTRLAFCLQDSIAIGTATWVAIGAAGPCLASTRPPANASETGWQGELVNRPGCWSEDRYSRNFDCRPVGWR